MWNLSGPLGAVLSRLARSWGILGRSWSDPGFSWGDPWPVLEPLGAILGPTWAILGGLGAILGRYWSTWGSKKALIFRRFFNMFANNVVCKKNSYLWPSWADLGAVLGPLVAILGRLGTVLGIFGAVWGPQGGHDTHLQCR